MAEAEAAAAKDSSNSELLKKTMELNQFYQQEMARLKEEEMKRWGDIVAQLNMLQNNCTPNELGEQAKRLIQNLQ